MASVKIPIKIGLLELQVFCIRSQAVSPEIIYMQAT